MSEKDLERLYNLLEKLEESRNEEEKETAISLKKAIFTIEQNGLYY